MSRKKQVYGGLGFDEVLIGIVKLISPIHERKHSAFHKAEMILNPPLKRRERVSQYVSQKNEGRPTSYLAGPGARC